MKNLNIHKKREILDMQCTKCEKVMSEKDFLKNEICYRCQYAIKIATKPPKLCKWCGNKAIGKGRWTYCSLECANKSAADMKKNYWTNSINIEKHSWGNNYII